MSLCVYALAMPGKQAHCKKAYRLLKHINNFPLFFFIKEKICLVVPFQPLLSFYC